MIGVTDLRKDSSRQRRAIGESVQRRRCRAPGAETHVVHCPYCQTEFELFAAVWCEHLDGEPSKLCPACRRCVCEHPAYAEPHFWKEAPTAFRAEGFRRLFLFYL